MSQIAKNFACIITLLGVVSMSTFVSAQQTEQQPQEVAPINLAEAAESVDDDGSLTAKASLLFGYNMAENMKRQGIELDIDKLVEGLKLSLDGGELPMDQEEAQSVLMAFRRAAQQKARAQQARLADENLAKGKTFMQKNAERDNVKSLENGVQYEILAEGSADAKRPAATDWVQVNYRGTSVDGKQFDASEKGEPAEFPVGGVIRGFSAALMEMKVGDKWKIVIPADLAYGKGGSPPRIGPNETLIFEVEMVDVIDKSDEGAPGDDDG